MHDYSQTPPTPGLRAGDHRPLAGLFRICVLAGLAANIGCVSFHQNHYLAGEVPTQYLASANQNPQLIDFTKLSSGVGDSNKIGPKDLLQVSIAANLNTQDVVSTQSRVNGQGLCNLPMVGAVHLGGMTLEEAEVAITEASIQRGLYRAPHVTVTIRKKDTIEVLVVGAVREQGKKIIPATENDLLSILFHAGGLADDAGPVVQVNNILSPEENRREAIADASTGGGVNQVGYASRGTPRSAEINLISATTSADGGQYFVGDGGVVMVERVDPKAVYIGGLVNKPGKYNYPVNKDLHLFDALSLAGWTKSQVATHVNVIRQSADGTGPVVIQANLRKVNHDPAHNLRLAPGDQIEVKQTPATVLLEVLRTVRVGWSLNPFL